jgi:hypothetical protein
MIFVNWHWIIRFGTRCGTIPFTVLESVWKGISLKRWKPSWQAIYLVFTQHPLQNMIVESTTCTMDQLIIFFLHNYDICFSKSCLDLRGSCLWEMNQPIELRQLGHHQWLCLCGCCWYLEMLAAATTQEWWKRVSASIVCVCRLKCM